MLTDCRASLSNSSQITLYVASHTRVPLSLQINKNGVYNVLSDKLKSFLGDILNFEYMNWDALNDDVFQVPENCTVNGDYFHEFRFIQYPYSYQRYQFVYTIYKYLTYR